MILDSYCIIRISDRTVFYQAQKIQIETFVQIINQVIIKMNEQINHERMRIHRL